MRKKKKKEKGKKKDKKKEEEKREKKEKETEEGKKTEDAKKERKDWICAGGAFRPRGRNTRRVPAGAGAEPKYASTSANARARAGQRGSEKKKGNSIFDRFGPLALSLFCNSQTVAQRRNFRWIFVFVSFLKILL